MALDPNRQIKAMPDVAKIQAMSPERVFMVARGFNPSPRATKTMVFQKAGAFPISEILDLQQSIPAKNGSGIYHFQISDTVSPESDEWQIKIGQDFEVQGAAPVGNSPLPANVELVHVGSGISYRPSLGGFVTPKGLFQWSGPPDPYPPEVNEQMAAASAAAAISTTPMQPGFAMPVPAAVPDVVQRELETLREQVRESRQRAETQSLLSTFSRMIEDSNKRIDLLAAKLTEKPTGPSAAEIALEKRAEQAEREAAEAKREQAQRDREASAEARFQQVIQQLAANRAPDPMMAMLVEVLRDQKTSGNEALRALTESSRSQIETVRQNAQMLVDAVGKTTTPPEKIFEMLGKLTESSRGGSREMGELFGMLTNGYKQLLELKIASEGAGQESMWPGLIRDMAGKLGAAAEHFSEYKAAQAEAEARRLAAVQAEQQRRAQAARRLPPQKPAVASVPERPSEPPREPPRLVTLPMVVEPPPPREAIAPPAEPAPSMAADEPVPVVEPPPPSQDATRAGKRGKKSREKQIEDLQTATLEEMRAAFGGHSDKEMFGLFMGKVQELRETLPKYGPDEVAIFILTAPKWLEQHKIDPPLGMTFLGVGQFEYLVDRLIPAATEEFREGVAVAIRAQLASEGQS